MKKASESSGTVLLEEKQKLPKWLTIVLISISICTLGIILIAALTGPPEQRRDGWTAFAWVMPIETFVVILFGKMELEKKITSNGFYYRWKPWQLKFRVIEKETIENWKVRKAPPLNYGIHWFPGYGWVHNARSGYGIQFSLTSGKKVFFGTSNTDLFREALERMALSNFKL